MMGKFEIVLAGVMGALVLGILASISASPDSVPSSMLMLKMTDEVIEKDEAMNELYALDDDMEIDGVEDMDKALEKIADDKMMMEEMQDEEMMDGADTLTVSIPSGSGIPTCAQTDECFIPAKMNIASGETVIWNNDDVAAHTVTSGMPSDGADDVFDSGLFLAGATFEHTFEDSGIFDYFCLVHPWMIGTIQVQ